MERVSISDFRTRCSAILKRVEKTVRPVRITRFGEPVGDVFPAAAGPHRKGWLGWMAGTCEIVGDIVAPVTADERARS